MSKTFDFIVLGGHGSGLNAFHAFANMITGIECIDWKISDDSLKKCLQYNIANKKGIVLDRADLRKKDRLSIIFNNLSPECILICLVRDPCRRLQSVVNTHVQWWAETVSGTFNLPLSANKMYKCGDELLHLKHILKAPTMNPLAEFYGELSKKCSQILFYDISALHPENAFSTFNNISEILLNSPLQFFQVPDCLPFSRDNLFVKFIKPLDIDKKVKIKPCPVEFLKFYGFAEKDILAKFAPKEYNFTLGNFSGDIAFVPVYPDNAASNIYIYIILSSCKIILTIYHDGIALQKNWPNRYFLPRKS